MNARSIINLLIIAAIFAVMSLSFLDKNSGIEKVLVSDNKDLSLAESSGSGVSTPVFNIDSDIYVIIFFKNIEGRTSINIVWENAGNNTYLPLQRDSLLLKEAGSGKAAVPLLKRNDSHLPGDYRVNVYFGEKALVNSFEVR